MSSLVSLSIVHGSTSRGRRTELSRCRGTWAILPLGDGQLQRTNREVVPLRKARLSSSMAIFFCSFVQGLVSLLSWECWLAWEAAVLTLPWWGAWWKSYFDHPSFGAEVMNQIWVSISIDIARIGLRLVESLIRLFSTPFFFSIWERSRRRSMINVLVFLFLPCQFQMPVNAMSFAPRQNALFAQAQAAGGLPICTAANAAAAVRGVPCQLHSFFACSAGQLPPGSCQVRKRKLPESKHSFLTIMNFLAHNIQTDHSTCTDKVEKTSFSFLSLWSSIDLDYERFTVIIGLGLRQTSIIF